MASEKLKFKIKLYSTYWDKAPGAEIFVNNKSFYKDTITGTEKNPTLIEFEEQLEEGQKYNLTIKRTGKDTTQTILDNDKKIIKCFQQHYSPKNVTGKIDKKTFKISHFLTS